MGFCLFLVERLRGLWGKGVGGKGSDEKGVGSGVLMSGIIGLVQYKRMHVSCFLL